MHTTKLHDSLYYTDIGCIKQNVREDERYDIQVKMENNDNGNNATFNCADRRRDLESIAASTVVPHTVLTKRFSGQAICRRKTPRADIRLRCWLIGFILHAGKLLAPLEVSSTCDQNYFK